MYFLDTKVEEKLLFGFGLIFVVFIDKIDEKLKMEFILRKSTVITIVFVIICGVLLIYKPGQVVAHESRSVTPSTTETWVMGVTVEGSAAYAETAGRMVTNIASFRAAKGTDMYYIFPASAEAKQVTEASFNIVSKEGSLPSSAEIKMEIVDMSGVVQHEASQTMDVLAPVVGTWVDFMLVDPIEDKTLEPGEVLVIHVIYPANANADLDLKILFDIEVD